MQAMNNLTISEPVVVGCSRPHETRWGFFQFPNLCRLPGGALMATVNDAEDATCGYGQPCKSVDVRRITMNVA